MLVGYLFASGVPVFAPSYSSVLSTSTWEMITTSSKSRWTSGQGSILTRDLVMMMRMMLKSVGERLAVLCSLLALVASTIFIFTFTFPSTPCSELLGLIQVFK